MNRSNIEKIQTEVLILGSGLAGLLLALELAQMNIYCILATKDTLMDSNTSCAQGGVAVVAGRGSFDSVERHLTDTIVAGAGLTDEFAARLIIEEGSKLIEKLTEFGVGFDRLDSGQLDLAREGGHSSCRVVHSRDMTGKAISQALISQVKKSDYISIVENTLALELLINEEICKGALMLVDDCRQVMVLAHKVILATGGAGQVYSRTTNPKVATGDGIAMAYRAGARLVDMEFVQFHPTALSLPGAPSFLISEALRGAGAVLLDGEGQPFAHKFHPDGELATRDVVALAIDTIMHEQKIPCVGLDVRHVANSEVRFANIFQKCRDFGLEPTKEPIPVAPAAHYIMGGIWTDVNGCTTIAGLYSIGESACVGLHGANRLASNSLLEAGVMSQRLARHISGSRFGRRGQVDVFKRAPCVVPTNLNLFRKEMFSCVGLVRDEFRLKKIINHEALRTIETARRDLIESSNIFLVGQLIAKSALFRCESRGSHRRVDYPQIDDIHFRKRLYLTAKKNGWLKLSASSTTSELQLA